LHGGKHAPISWTATLAVHQFDKAGNFPVERLLMSALQNSWEATRIVSAPQRGGYDECPPVRGGATDENSNDYTVRHIHSAGGVAYRLQQADAQSFFEVAVIATDRECRRWQLPKGRLYPTEQPLTAALREVEEETGLETEFESFLKTVHYIYLDTYARTVPERVFKKVDFFSAARSGWASLRCQCRSPKGRMGLSRRRSGAAGIRR
jgi:ADP-ribose pyrophosphatase YjhB (NUDIX family)